MTAQFNRPVRTAVFPVAGLGTRILPATKVLPKEMMPVVDRPVLQRAVEEARAAGITDFVFVSSSGKTILEDHFDRRHELNATLERRGKTDALAAVMASEIPTGHLSVVRQHTPLGLGHAVWCARKAVGDEPFAVLLPDDMFLGAQTPLQQLMESYQQTGGNYIAAMEVREDQVSSKGIVTPGQMDGRRVEVKGLVEKPKLAEAPSRIAILGRYILQPEIFDILETIGQGSGGEIQLTDGLQKLLQQQPFYARLIDSEFLDCGDKLGWLEANVAFALADPALRASVITMLKSRLENV